MTATAESETSLRVRGRDARATAAIAVALLLITAALFGRAVVFDFVNYDDDVYVYQNRHVTGGLSWDDAKWAFTTGHAANWHPLTWLSLQADVSLFGGGARAHHAVNVVLHAASAAVLFLALVRMTRDAWPAALAAALFAVHPLRVESVAWVAERKDVLCGFFWALTMLAYASYAQRPTFLRYLCVTCPFALSLLSKPMAVTLPLALLLLDRWPLRRRAVIEKIPWLMMSAAAACATLWAQSRGGAMTGEALSFGDRAVAAIHAYAKYVMQTVWPTGLAPFYPHPQQPPESGLSWPAIVASAAVVIGLAGVAIACRRRAPWATAGVLWFLGTLVPVVGIVQVGMQSHADRYTYVPSIGLAVAVAWTAAAIVRHRPAARGAIVTLAAVVSLVLSVATFVQLGHWRNSEALWRHAAAVVPRNYIAHGNLGHALYARGDRDAAMREFKAAIDVNPRYGQGLHNYGAMLAESGRDEEALPYLQRALQVGDTPRATSEELRRLYARQNNADAALAAYQAVLEKDPNHASALHALATLRAQRGEVGEAITLWRRVIAIDPHHAEAQHRLGLALVLTGSTGEGVEHLRVAHRLAPEKVETLTWLAWTLATTADAAVRSPGEGLAFAARAVELSQPEPSIMTLDALAAARAANGRFDEAAATARHAIGRASAAGQRQTAEQLESRLRLYESRRPYVQPSP